MTAASLIRSARRKAGLSQAELAARLGTTQSAVARLESERSNPRLSTLEQALAAAGRRLELKSAPAPASQDESLISRRLALTPGERVTAFESAYRNTKSLLASRR
ncbi:MAG TPA: helix-turn-helix transcriptional regulator [Thermoleophilaceae bacterium]